MASSVIAEGNLKKTGTPFEIRNLHSEDLNDMFALQETVKRTMENPETLQTLNLKEFEYIFADKGFIIGAYADDKMIAFRAMLVPPLDDPEHLGTDAGVMKEDLHKVIYSEITVVHPKYRGNGLQTFMGEIVFEQVDKEHFPYVAATVAPFNIPSLKDKLALGMEIIWLEEKYNGKLRYVLFRNMTGDRIRYTSKRKKVAMDATETQQEWMREGYRGVAIERIDEVYQVIYEK